MAQKYTIYINENRLLITDITNFKFDDFQLVEAKNFNFNDFYQGLDLQKKENFLITSPQASAIFSAIKKSLQYIQAAGGLVSNANGDFLFIYRNGKWDLPKGKVEIGEPLAIAAKREVEEECNVRVQSKTRLITKTYHVYKMDNQLVLKQTTWYNMNVSGQPTLIPQLEEGISEVQWVKPDEIRTKTNNTYPSILDVLRQSNLA
jgi:8-oxo-dGTP pyrophosphatase MutT (NUDIX family)